MPEIYFAQIREDNLVERTAIDRFGSKSIVCIGSGGCNAFSLLSDHLSKIYCIDNNPAQTALIELKKAGIKNLSRNEYLAFIGEEFSDNRIDIFKQLLSDISPGTQKFWEERQSAIILGINKSGVTEHFYQFISQNIFNAVYGPEIWNRLFEANTLEEQHEFYNKYLTNEKWHTAVKILLSKNTHLLFFPAFMFANASTNDFSSFFLERFTHEINNKLVMNNYFLSQFLFGKYLFNKQEGSPYYLSVEGFQNAKNNLDKLSVVCDNLDSVCKDLKDIDAFLLSNVFDWCNDDQRKSICKTIDTAKSRQSILLFRNMLSENGINKLLTKSNYLEDLSNDLTFMERSMMYRKISLIEL